MKRWMKVLAGLALGTVLLGTSAFAKESAPLYVGGVELAPGQYLDLSGNVSAEKPEGGYAYHGEDGVLTLHDYSYTGDGYVYGGEEDARYSALIWREGDIDILLEGKNYLRNTYTDDEQGYFGDAIWADPTEDGTPSSMTVKGEGAFLEIGGCDFGVAAYQDLLIEGVEMSITCRSTGLHTGYGTMSVKNARFDIHSEGDGIDAGGDVFVTDTVLELEAGWTGIYVRSGDLHLEYTKSSPAAPATRVQISDFESEKEYLPLQVFHGELYISENLMVSLPAESSIKTFDGLCYCGGNDVADNPCTYRALADAAGKEAVSVTIEPVTPALVDVPADAWYAPAVEYVTEKGIMDATEEGVFSPEGGVNRAMMAKFLWNMAGNPVVNAAMNFSDVKEGQWYSEAVGWAAAEGFMQGYGNGRFGLGDELTREQLATILYRYEKKQGGGFQGMWMFLLDCADREEISPWAYEALCWMKMKGIMQGKGEYMAPRDMVLNAEAAQIFMGYLER